MEHSYILYFHLRDIRKSGTHCCAPNVNMRLKLTIRSGIRVSMKTPGIAQGADAPTQRKAIQGLNEHVSPMIHFTFIIRVNQRTSRLFSGSTKTKGKVESFIFNECHCQPRADLGFTTPSLLVCFEGNLNKMVRVCRGARLSEPNQLISSPCSLHTAIIDLYMFQDPSTQM